MEKQKKLHYDVWVGTALIILGAIVMVSAFKMPVVPKRFTLITSIMCIVLAASILFQGIKKSKNPEIAAEKAIKLNESKYPLTFFLITLAYLILMKYITFFVATTIYSVVIMLFMGVKSKKTIIINTIFTDVFVWVVFVKLLSVNLP